MPMSLTVTRALQLSWRVCGAAVCYLVFALGASIPALLAICLRVLPLTDKQRRRITRGTIRYLCRFYLNVMRWTGLLHHSASGLDARIKGHLVVANHPTLLDAIFIMAYLPDVCCIAKPGLAN